MTSSKRSAGEKFALYKKRLKTMAQDLKRRMRGGIRIIEIPKSSGRPGQHQYTPENMKFQIVYPKRHKGEPFAAFKLRRKLSNQRRREKETNVKV